jgi:glycosyltransferase involved in cell wall biosynthesis
VTTCSEAARADLAALAPPGRAPLLVYHGLDLTRFAAPEGARPKRDGSDAGDPVRLLTVGRAVEKKGHDVLIRALAALPATLNWRWVHIGGGALLATLKAQAEAAGIADRTEWRGSRPQADVLDALREADLFVLANRVARDGDRDGLPNVLLEAQSQALPCIASAVSGVTELLVDGATGLVVPAENPAALSEAMAALIADPARRAAMGEAGLARVRDAFDAAGWARRLHARFAADGLGGDAEDAAAAEGSRAA